MGSAYAECSETFKGSITPGKLADIVVLQDDLFAIPAQEIDESRVVLTIFNGRVEYEAK
jgi:hypothetical protein